MGINRVATIEFTDTDSGDAGILIVRAGKGMIGLCVSLKSDGDVQVFFQPKDSERLVSALSEARLVAMLG